MTKKELKDKYLGTKESRRFGETKVEWVINNIKSNMICVDVGSCLGFYTELLCDICTEGFVFAIEPSLENFKLTNERVRKYKRVKVYNYALSNVSKAGTLYLGNKSGWNSLLDSHGGKEQDIYIITLDKLLQNKKIDFIKIDVEGMDLEVLEGSRNIIENSPKLKMTMEVHKKRFNVDSEKIFKFLSERKFEIKNLIAKDLVEAPKNMTEEIICEKISS